MKAATPDFKRKLYRRLRATTGLLAVITSFTLLGVSSCAPNVYSNVAAATDAQETLREQEIEALTKRINGIGPMQRYVAGITEQADVIVKLPQDALPAGTDAEKLRRQSEQLNAAVNAEVAATTHALWLSPNLRRRDTMELSGRLDAVAGRKTSETFNRDRLSDNFYALVHFRQCKADVIAQPSFKPGEAAVKQALDCAVAKAEPYSNAVQGTTATLAFFFVAGWLLRRRLGRQIAAEDAAAARAAEQAAAAAATAAPPAPPQPTTAAPINTATGQDITVKPIKITAKAPGAAA